MAGSDQSINNVRSILGKMDRSISDARRRRLGEPDPVSANGVSEEDDLMIGQAEDPAAETKAEQAEPEQISPMRARYGKARPIDSNGTGPIPPQPPSRDDDHTMGFHARGA